MADNAVSWEKHAIACDPDLEPTLDADTDFARSVRRWCLLPRHRRLRGASSFRAARFGRKKKAVRCEAIDS
jgi:hypothetical protein